MARVWMFSSLMVLPTLAHAYGGYGGGKGGFSVLLMAGVAVLGYWILKQNKSDKGALMWAGRAIGWTLAVVGLLGFLCSAGSLHKRGYNKKDCKRCLTKIGKAHAGHYGAVEKKFKKTQR